MYDDGDVTECSKPAGIKEMKLICVSQHDAPRRPFRLSDVCRVPHVYDTSGDHVLLIETPRT